VGGRGDEKRRKKHGKVQHYPKKKKKGTPITNTLEKKEGAISSLLPPFLAKPRFSVGQGQVLCRKEGK